jgi:hypothetical protein
MELSSDFRMEGVVNDALVVAATNSLKFLGKTQVKQHMTKGANRAVLK